jgi:hypothetical protein
MKNLRQLIAIAVITVLAPLVGMSPAAAADSGSGGQSVQQPLSDRLYLAGHKAPGSRLAIRTLGQGLGGQGLGGQGLGGQRLGTASRPAAAKSPKSAALADDDDGFESLPLDRFGASGRGGAPERLHLVVRGIEGPAMLPHDCALAEKGDAAAAYRLGRRYLFGIGVSRDRRMGVAWMRASASRGYHPALEVAALVPVSLGRMRPWCRPNTAPLRTPTAPPETIAKLVRDMAPAYGLDPQLVLAVIEVESAFHTDSVSPKDAAGLMQLVPATAARFGVNDVFDPADNIRGGMKYLQWLLSYFEGNVTLALAGYNAGEHAVDRHGGVPPYPETEAYVRLVHGLYPKTGHRFDPSVTEPSSHFARQTAAAAP